LFKIHSQNNANRSFASVYFEECNASTVVIFLLSQSDPLFEQVHLDFMRPAEMQLWYCLAMYVFLLPFYWVSINDALFQKASYGQLNIAFQSFILASSCHYCVLGPVAFLDNLSPAQIVGLHFAAIEVGTSSVARRAWDSYT
jgi:hypothetical protein